MLTGRILITDNHEARLDSAIRCVQGQLSEPLTPAVALVLGSGLGDIAKHFDIVAEIPYRDIDGFPHSTAPGHEGKLLLATVTNKLGKLDLLVFQGRLHLYEGWQPAEIAMMPRLARGLGAEYLLLTNAVGALNPDWSVAEVMLVEDHINFTGQSPLTGPNAKALGMRFPDQSRIYDSEWRQAAAMAADATDLVLRRGIYAGVAGPELETSAERRFMRMAGADVVGMSLVMEAIAANHCGLKILALAAITNVATGSPEQQPDTVEEVLAHAEAAGKKIARLLPELLEHIQNHC